MRECANIRIRRGALPGSFAEIFHMPDSAEICVISGLLIGCTGDGAATFGNVLYRALLCTPPHIGTCARLWLLRF